MLAPVTRTVLACPRFTTASLADAPLECLGVGSGIVEEYMLHAVGMPMIDANQTCPKRAINAQGDPDETSWSCRKITH